MKPLTAFVVGLAIGLILLLANNYKLSKAIDDMKLTYQSIIQEDIKHTEIDRKVLSARLASAEGDVLQLQRDLLVVTQNYKLIMTFAESGRSPESISEVQKLVAEFDKLPFGSPFADGYIPTSPFGNGAPTWYRPSGVHLGVDLVTKGSWVVVATADGEIVEYGETDNLGKYIIYQTDTGYEQVYGHLDKIYWQDVTLRVVKGVKVKKGTPLGVAGNTGRLTTGRHLHYEIRRLNIDSIYVSIDPEAVMQFIGKRP